MSSIASLPMSSWSLERKAAAGVFALAGMAALACAALYLSGVVFLLLNKVNPRHAEFASIVQYWDRYADDPRRRKQLIGSMAASGFGMMVVLPFSLVAAARSRRPLHGDARFANPAEVMRAGLVHNGRRPTQPSIIVGDRKSTRLNSSHSS